MARRNAVREQLLAEAKARRRAAGQKVSRLERAGVRIKTNGLDPRAGADITGMSARQLRAHIAKLNAFTSRSNGYVPGLGGAPLSASTVREYRAAERARNTASAKFYESIKDLPVRGLGQTIEERLESLARGKSAFGDYFSFALPNRAGQYPERNLSNVTGQASLKDLLKQMQSRNDPRYLEREAKVTRNILSKILAKTGLTDLLPDIKRLDDDDLIAMTQYMGFTKTAEGRYALSKSISSDSPAWQSSVYEDSEDILREQLESMLNRNRTSTGQDTETDAKPARRDNAPGRDRYGRFVRRDADNPAPEFKRDQFGRFTTR